MLSAAAISTDAPIGCPEGLLLLVPHHGICAAGDLALLEQVKQLIPRLTYQQIQDNPFADGVSADVSEDAQDIVPLVIDAILGFCRAQLCDFTSAFVHGTRMMKGVIEVLRIGLLARRDPIGIVQVSVSSNGVTSTKLSFSFMSSAQLIFLSECHACETLRMKLPVARGPKRHSLSSLKAA